MTLISLNFILFFIIVLCVYYIIPHKFQWYVLLIASIVFFVTSAIPHTLIYLIISIVSIYFATRYIDKANRQIDNANISETAILDIKRRRKAVFIIAIIINIGMLALLKYTNFFLQNINALANVFGAELPVGAVRWLAPLGISFYTLQIVGYLTDVYWGTSKAQPNILKVALFASYFPQMTTGPISRYSQLENQLYAEHKFDFKQISRGATRMAWGFFKKLVIADRIGILATSVYSSVPDYYPGLYVWVGTFAYVLQLYADFSGCMDIVIGASECLGIKLPENFRTPFYSRSTQEFWQRWHITLGTWLKDYIMYPILRSKSMIKWGAKLKKKVSKKAAQKLPVYVAMLVLWLALGVWHGDGWKYIFEGLWFWAIIILSQLLTPLFKKTISFFKIKTETFSWHLFQSIRTTLIFAVGGVLFFGALNLKTAFSMIKSALTVFNSTIFFNGDLITIAGGERNLQIVAVGLLILIIVEAFQARGQSVRTWLSEQNIIFRWIILYGLIFMIIVFGLYGPGYNPADFIYGRF